MNAFFCRISEISSFSLHKIRRNKWVKWQGSDKKEKDFFNQFGIDKNNEVLIVFELLSFKGWNR